MYEKYCQNIYKWGFYFEGLFARDIIVQLKFEFDELFKSYNFLNFKIACMWHCTWAWNLGCRAKSLP